MLTASVTRYHQQHSAVNHVGGYSSAVDGDSNGWLNHMTSSSKQSIDRLMRPAPTVTLRYFNVALEDIVRTEQRSIPRIVTDIAFFIYQQGIDVEGIFRVNGNSKSLEKLRSCYDRNGSADLQSCADVMTIGALLKVFLRELPDGLIPLHFTAQFVAVQDLSKRDPQECLLAMRKLLRQLPEHNYTTLKFIIAFLVCVTRDEDVNKMNAMALAIVFGPTIFRCAPGFEGLKQQGIANYVTSTFIMKYDALFLEKNEISPHSTQFVLTSLTEDNINTELQATATPVTAGGGTGLTAAAAAAAAAAAGDDDDEDSLCSPQSLTSPQLNVDSESSDAGSLHTATLNTRLQRAIRCAIRQHIFDETTDNTDSEDDSPVYLVRKNIADLSIEDIDTTITPILTVKPASPVRTSPALQSQPPPLPPRAAITSTSTQQTPSDDSSTDDETSTDSETPPLEPRRPHNSRDVNDMSPVKHKHQTPTWNNRQPLKDNGPPPALPLKTYTNNAGGGGGAGAGAGGGDGDSSTTAKQLTRQIQVAKKGIKELEAEFEQEHGYKPSKSEKAADIEMKKLMTELFTARKHLSELRGVTDDVTSPPVVSSGVSSTAVNAATTNVSIEATLVLLLRKLTEKRREAHRPEDLAKMSRDEVKEEKLCIQKALLHFETLHGRPTSVRDKETMHPLYDRYRQIKRILAVKHSSSDDDVDDNNYNTATRTTGASSGTGGGTRTAVGTSGTRGVGLVSSASESDINTVQNTSFISASTQSTLATVKTYRTNATTSTLHSASSRDTVINTQQPAQHSPTHRHTPPPPTTTAAAAAAGGAHRLHHRPNSPTHRHTHQQSGSAAAAAAAAAGGGGDAGDVDDMMLSSNGVNINQLTTTELQLELDKTTALKKKLQIELHNFEQAFINKFGRRLQRADRLIKESDYRQYKAVKGKLKLLEALLTKRERAKKP